MSFEKQHSEEQSVNTLSIALVNTKLEDAAFSTSEKQQPRVRDGYQLTDT